MLLAGLLLVVGIVLLAQQLDMLPAIDGANVWHWLMLGGGSLLILSEVVRAAAVPYSQPSTARLILGAAFLGIALTGIFALDPATLWPAALLAIGLILLLRSIASSF